MSLPTSDYTIPQEIIDIVIDELFGTQDKRNLLNIALISRSSLHRARFHLFGSINLERSACPPINSEDSAIFYSILKDSPPLGLCIRDLVVRNPFLTAYNQPNPPGHCMQHAGTEDQHTCTLEEMQLFSMYKAGYFSLISTFLPSLRSVRIIYDPTCTHMAWHGLPEWNTVALFCIRDSLTSISLSSIEDFPFSLLSSILKLSQLTSLIINGITVKDDTGSNKMPVTSQLDKLQMLCITSHSINTYDLTTLLPAILTTALQSLSQLRWYDAASYHRQLKYSHIPIQGLTKLREFSTSVDGHRITLLSVVHQIVASQRRGIQVLELFDADVLEVEVNVKSHEQLWGEFDQLFQEEAFADLREIRFLVKKILTNESIPICYHPIVGRIFTTEEVVSFFASFCPRAMARGVRFTYAEEREALSIK